MRRIGGRKALSLCLAAGIVFAVMALAVYASGEAPETGGSFYGTFWALVPALVTIILALISKEVYLSLFAGIFVGALLYTNFDPVHTVITICGNLVGSVTDEWNAGVLIFLVILGALVALLNKAGGSAAYARWAAQRIKSRKGALLATMGLGVLIFIDDYFNCLTVGSVMMPVTDKYKISRAKLSYIIDATAAPVCIIAPISSWVAAVTGSVTSQADAAGNVIPVDGFLVFLQTIPHNYYAILTITFMIGLILMDFDYGPMKKAQQMTDQTGDVLSGTPDEYANVAETKSSHRGRAYDLLVPVVVLIALCIISLLYTGGFFEGVPFATAFSNADASAGLVIGSLVTMAFCLVYFLARRVVTIKEFAECLPDGFRQMTPAILILVFAWTLAGICEEGLGASAFVGRMMESAAGAMVGVLPAAMFLIACFVAFSTGSSWGTFAILIPIAQAVFPGAVGPMLVITVAATLAGAVFGDHCSPIADTTIMASAGARVNHILHVSTQLPYTATVAAICLVCYLLAGFLRSWAVVLPIGIGLVLAALFVLKKWSLSKPVT